MFLAKSWVVSSLILGTDGESFHGLCFLLSLVKKK